MDDFPHVAAAMLGVNGFNACKKDGRAVSVAVNREFQRRSLIVTLCCTRPRNVTGPWRKHVHAPRASR